MANTVDSHAPEPPRRFSRPGFTSFVPAELGELEVKMSLSLSCYMVTYWPKGMPEKAVIRFFNTKEDTGKFLDRLAEMDTSSDRGQMEG